MQLAVNPGRTPTDVVSTRAPNEFTDFPLDPRSTGVPVARLPGPIIAKAHAVPTHQPLPL